MTVPTPPREPAPGTAAIAVLTGPRRSRAALRWAAAEARRRGAPLEVLVTRDDPDTDAPAGPAGLDRALSLLRDAVPGLPLSTRARTGRAVDVVRAHSALAAAVVLPADLPDLGAVIAAAYSPVVVVPERRTTPGAPVVVGVAPWTDDQVIDLAFRAAAERRVRLIAVRTWDDPAIDLARLRPERIARWDRAENRAREDLEMALSARRIVHPEVPVQTIVAQDRADDLLLALSVKAQLMVVGRSERGTLLAGLAGSPVDALLRGAACPVAVVSGDGPPRTGWLPSRAHGWAVPIP